MTLPLQTHPELLHVFRRVIALQRRKQDAAFINSPGAFTLVELLTVIAIMVVIAGFVVPAAAPLLRGNQITQSGQTINDQLAFARQRALARNEAIEVRFYQYGDPEVPGEKPATPSSGKYRAVQCFEVLASGSTVAIDKARALPPSVIFDSSSTLSTLLNQSTRPPQAGTVSIPRVGTNYKFVRFRFHADGSTDLPLTGSGSDPQWFLTLHSINYGDALSNPPANFVTIQIDPINGKTRSFRP